MSGFKFTENQLKWLEALESGKYKQGKGYLKQKNPNNPDEYLYCCLGVACEVLGEESKYDEAFQVFMYDGSIYLLPFEIRNLLDIRDIGGHHYIGGRGCSLTMLNDRENLDFPAIARYIRENAELIFNVRTSEAGC